MDTNEQIYEVQDGNKNNCINCFDFKLIKGTGEYARCVDKYSPLDGIPVRVSSTAKRITTCEKDNKMFSRMDCNCFKGEEV